MESNIVKFIKHKNNYTSAQMAEIIGISMERYRIIESDPTELKIKCCNALIKHFDLNPMEFIIYF